ncbi:MAG: tungstate ABC transporter substrate-binding protein WtpA [Salinivirgaceae bacterium]|nr:tungstate ABC transporter substrate-binding protein WtpA [Salinivirgaceae bacterium]
MKTSPAKFILLIFGVLSISNGCKLKHHPQSQELIIFHAGSLSVPFKQIADSFETKYPEIKVYLEAAGSRACARKITDLNKPCDIMASADYAVIDELLIPNYAKWSLKFAGNEMCIVYTPNSKRQQGLNASNWYRILLDPEVRYGRADPESDPCGYRTVLVSKLAEKFYQTSGLSALLMQKDQNHIRPKEVDLLALLETQTIDYIFLYRSVAKQHQLNYLVLPDSINLKTAELTNFYKQVSIQLHGTNPNESTTYCGEPMVYGITQLENAPNPEASQKFLEFFFADSVGLKIMEQNGQPSCVPAGSNTYNYLPGYLKKFASEK